MLRPSALRRASIGRLAKQCAAEVVGKSRAFMKACRQRYTRKCQGAIMFGFLRKALPALGLRLEPCRRRRPLPRRRLSQPPGALADRLRRRRPGRYRRAHHEPVAVGPFRPAIRGGEPHRLRRQHRRRRRDRLAAGRLHAAVRRAQQRDLDLALQEAAVSISCATPRRSPASCSSPTCWWCRTRCRSRPSRSSSTTARPTPARSPMPRPATAPRCTCRRSCSRR